MSPLIIFFKPTIVDPVSSCYFSVDGVDILPILPNALMNQTESMTASSSTSANGIVLSNQNKRSGVDIFQDERSRVLQRACAVSL